MRWWQEPVPGSDGHRYCGAGRLQNLLQQDMCLETLDAGQQAFYCVRVVLQLFQFAEMSQTAGMLQNIFLFGQEAIAQQTVRITQ